MTIEEICKKYGIENYTIMDDGSIDVDGDVYINDEGLTELPLTFNKVTGSFVFKEFWKGKEITFRLNKF